LIDPASGDPAFAWGLSFRDDASLRLLPAGYGVSGFCITVMPLLPSP